METLDTHKEQDQPQVALPSISLTIFETGTLLILSSPTQDEPIQTFVNMGPHYRRDILAAIATSPEPIEQALVLTLLTLMGE